MQFFQVRCEQCEAHGGEDFERTPQKVEHAPVLFRPLQDQDLENEEEMIQGTAISVMEFQVKGYKISKGLAP